MADFFFFFLSSAGPAPLLSGPSAPLLASVQHRSASSLEIFASAASNFYSHSGCHLAPASSFASASETSAGRLDTPPPIVCHPSHAFPGLPCWRASSCYCRFLLAILAQRAGKRAPHAIHNYDTTANPRSENPSPAIRPLNAPAPGPAATLVAAHWQAQRQDAAGALRSEPGLRLARRSARLRLDGGRASEEAAPGARTSPRRHSSVSHEPPRRQEGQGQDRRRRC